MKEYGLKYPPIVKSLLDTDLYKFSMGQVYYHQYQSDLATWDFKARNVGESSSHEKFTSADVDEIIRQVEVYCALRFDEDELECLTNKFPWIHTDYVNFLRFWHPDFRDFTINGTGISGLSIHFSGVQAYVSFYEIPILEIVAEVYYRNHYDYNKLISEFKSKSLEKIELLKSGKLHPFTFSEFGARRRLSFEAQDWLIRTLSESNVPGFMGTSNVYLSKKYNTNAAGTMAHELIMTVGQGHPRYNPAYSNWYSLDSWVKEYGTWNGIALTDTIGTDAFLLDFQKTFATLFSGVRHDSGDPIEWGDKIINHYKSLGIDPMTKTLLFSDSLNLNKASDIAKYFEGKSKVAFGIGTDWSGPQSIDALNIVCKVALVNGLDVAKLSDAPGKNMCRSPDYIDYLKRSISWRLNH